VESKKAQLAPFLMVFGILKSKVQSKKFKCGIKKEAFAPFLIISVMFTIS
jgi:hypothetical protein